MKISYLSALILSAAASLAVAQYDQDEPPQPPSRGDQKPGDHRGPPGRPAPPLLAALDIDCDGTLSADEIAKASQSLLKLDANHDGTLSGEEMRPVPPEGKESRPKPPGKNGSRQGGPNSNQSAPPPPPQRR